MERLLSLIVLQIKVSVRFGTSLLSCSQDPATEEKLWFLQQCQNSQYTKSSRYLLGVLSRWCIEMNSLVLNQKRDMGSDRLYSSLTPTKLIIFQWLNSSILSSLMWKMELLLISWSLILNGQQLLIVEIIHAQAPRIFFLASRTPNSVDLSLIGLHLTSRLLLTTQVLLHISRLASLKWPWMHMFAKQTRWEFSCLSHRMKINWTGQCSQSTLKSKELRWKTISMLSWTMFGTDSTLVKLDFRDSLLYSKGKEEVFTIWTSQEHQPSTWCSPFVLRARQQVQLSGSLILAQSLELSTSTVHLLRWTNGMTRSNNMEK